MPASERTVRESPPTTTTSANVSGYVSDNSFESSGSEDTWLDPGLGLVTPVMNLVGPALFSESLSATPRATTRVAYVNLKGGLNPEGRTKLPLSAPDRLSEFIWFCNSIGASVGAGGEFNSLQWGRLVERHTRWQGFHAHNLTRNGVGIGNFVAWRERVWRSEKRHTIVVEDVLSNYNPPKLNLNFPAVKLRHQRTGVAVWFVSAHFPAGTRPRIVAEKVRCAVEIVEFQASVKEQVVVLADMNAGEVQPITRWMGFNYRPDHIRVSTPLNWRSPGAVSLRDHRVHFELGGKVTDHRAGISSELVIR